MQEMQEMWVQSLGQEDLLEEEMAPHSSIFAWKISWAEEPGRLQSMGPQRVGYNWAHTHTHICTCVCILFQVLFHYRLLHAIEYSSLCYTVGPSYLFYIWSEVLVAQLCPTLWFPMGCSLPGSYAHGTLQAKILQWIAIPFSKRSSWPRNQTLSPVLQADSLQSEPPDTYIYSSGYSETSFIKALLTFYEGSTFMI